MGDQNPQGAGEPVYTVPEIAALARVNVSTVRRRIIAGEIPAFRVGRQYRVRESVLDAILGEIDPAADTRATVTP